MKSPKTIQALLVVWLWCLTFLGAESAGLGAAAPGAKPAPKTAPAVVEIPKSSFTYDLASRGKDPFNPALVASPEPAAGTTNAVTAVAGTPGNATLFLKGIILGANHRRLAVINNGVFGVGDTTEVNVTGGKAIVHCLEIGDGYAVVTVAGSADRQMLRMRKE
jgi:hypothetical protein